MGNRAVITEIGSAKGVYIHWNGGRDSVAPIAFVAHNFVKDMDGLEAFAFVAKCFGLCPVVKDVSSLDCDNGDNGVYFIKGGEIVGRAFVPDCEGWKEQSAYDFDEFVSQLNESLPKCYRNDREGLAKFLASNPLVDKWENRFNIYDEEKRLRVGDEVLYHGTWVKVVGYRKSHDPINGSDRYGQPYFNAFGHSSCGLKPWADDDPRIEGNPNCYFGLDEYGYVDDKNLRILDKGKYAELKAKLENSAKEGE